MAVDAGIPINGNKQENDKAELPRRRDSFVDCCILVLPVMTF